MASLNNKNKQIGRVTLPAQTGMEREVVELIERWGADAIRDSDGTKLSAEIIELGTKIYSKYFVARGDNEWAESNMEQVQQLYLMSKQVTAIEETLKIDILDGYFEQQFKIDTIHDPKIWWEVRDRTTGNIVEKDNWEFNSETGYVIIQKAEKWHSYTVSFLVYQIWDTTQMYNHITNDWGDKPHEIPFDVHYPETREHVLNSLEKWLKEHPSTDVVRFTTFFYHFILCFNNLAKEKYVDWFGYGASISIPALERFEEEKGYKLTPEDMVDEGFYNSPFRIPRKEFLDYMDFQQQFVSKLAAKCVKLVHDSGKEAIMFLGDNWIGTEPYGKYFANIGLDAVVGSVGNGTTLRMISEIPNVRYTEGRFLPYFFPDVFNPEGDPVKEGVENWIQARRAILRKPVDRIGYGGYLSLAVQFPEFVEKVEQICNEFREIHMHMKGTKPYSAPFKIAVLNCWGKIRSWQTHMVTHAIWYKQIYSYSGILEALSGMSVDVEFINFEDISRNGIPDDVGVIINAGDAHTAWSGGSNWIDEDIISKIREWVYKGGGFIGVGEPTAHQHQGRYFQMADVLGVDKEIGYGINTRKYNTQDSEAHFILEDAGEIIDFGESMKNVFVAGEKTKALKVINDDVLIATNEYGKGRSVYIAGLPYNLENNRMLLRAIFWSASREDEMKKWFSSNYKTECAVFPDAHTVIIINNVNESQKTCIYDDKGNQTEIILEPYGVKYLSIDEIK